MRIGILSDTHDNIWKIDKVFEKMKAEKVEALIHCGDFCAPFVIKKLAELGVPVHCVFGNTDDRFTTSNVVQGFENINLYGEIAEFELGGKKFAVNHYPHFAEALAATGKYDVVCYGHNHIKDEKRVGKTLMINPGEGSGVAKSPTFAIYNTEEDKVEFFDI
ncbi:metallophosphoesterase [Candidatus Woesearchaeota archaeon]|nr:metallophosphoesterase [Candidatus Woesearchaeota archaeon]